MVVALQANYLEVELDVAPDGCPGRLLCTRRTRLSHRGEAVYVGDRVRVEAIDPGQGRAVVAEVEPRHSFLTRPPVANVSLVAVVLAVEQPSFDPDQASRFLLTAERTGLEVILLLTKTDLLSAAALERLVTRLQGWGYDPLVLSSAAGTGIDALRQRLAGAQLSVLCGPSGVGKSSLLNQLLPGLELQLRRQRRHFVIGDVWRVRDDQIKAAVDLGEPVALAQERAFRQAQHRPVARRHIKRGGRDIDPQPPGALAFEDWMQNRGDALALLATLHEPFEPFLRA